MTDKQIEKMKKYVELIRQCGQIEGIFSERYTPDKHNEVLPRLRKYGNIADYLILRMEREMKR